ncbi:MAG: hypothetical protein AAFX45_08435 [Pseudomonadota bacterium]
MSLPTFLTKYFKPGDKRWYEDGTIRFGNLAEYRRAEEEQSLAARGDKNEGLNVTSNPIQPKGSPGSSDPVERSKWQAWSARQQTFNQGLPPNYYVSRSVIHSKMNAWVFCASTGAYDPAHHDLMLNGDRLTGYKGSPELLAYCVFNTSELIRAARSALRCHENYNRVAEYPKVLYWREVDYDWEINETNDGAGFFEAMTNGQKPLSDDSVVQSLTTKRAIFSTEKELRLIARIVDRRLLDNEPALLVNSASIRNAIIEFGELK